jgi:hypothetical protein
MTSLLHQTIVEGECYEIAKKAQDYCHKEMKPFYSHFQDLATFSKEVCDLKYIVIPICTENQIYNVSGIVVLLNLLLKALLTDSVVRIPCGPYATKQVTLRSIATNDDLNWAKNKLNQIISVSS